MTSAHSTTSTAMAQAGRAAMEPYARQMVLLTAKTMNTGPKNTTHVHRMLRAHFSPSSWR